MDLPRAFNGELVFTNELQVLGLFGEEVALVQEIFHGGRFHVSADGTIAPSWQEGLRHIQCQIDLLDDTTLNAVWADMDGKSDVTIPVQFSPRGDFRSYLTSVSKGRERFFFDELRYASINQ